MNIQDSKRSDSQQTVLHTWGKIPQYAGIFLGLSILLAIFLWNYHKPEKVRFQSISDFQNISLALTEKDKKISGEEFKQTETSGKILEVLKTEIELNSGEIWELNKIQRRKHDISDKNFVEIWDFTIPKKEGDSYYYFYIVYTF